MSLARRLSALLVALLAAGGVAQAQDFEREQRWASEVVPALVVGEAVQLPGPGGRSFLGLLAEADKADKLRTAIVLVHGVGVHPDHGVIGALRASLADAGFTTLSIQMPVQRSDAAIDDYHPNRTPGVFDNAVARIGAAVAWMRARGHGKVVLLSHSMGSWMSNVYYERTEQSAAQPAFDAWVCMGLTGGYGWMGHVKVPVLDVYGENDLPPVVRAAGRRQSTLEGLPAAASSRQVRIAGADHHYAGREKELSAAIESFVRGSVLK